MKRSTLSQLVLLLKWSSLVLLIKWSNLSHLVLLRKRSSLSHLALLMTRCSLSIVLLRKWSSLSHLLLLLKRCSLSHLDFLPLNVPCLSTTTHPIGRGKWDCISHLVLLLKRSSLSHLVLFDTKLTKSVSSMLLLKCQWKVMSIGWAVTSQLSSSLSSRATPKILASPFTHVGVSEKQQKARSFFAIIIERLTWWSFLV